MSLRKLVFHATPHGYPIRSRKLKQRLKILKRLGLVTIAKASRRGGGFAISLTDKGRHQVIRDAGSRMNELSRLLEKAVEPYERERDALFDLIKHQNEVWANVMRLLTE